MPKLPTSDKRRLAVAVDDLDRLAPEIYTQYIAGRLDLGEPFRVIDNNKPRALVAFACPLLEAALVVDHLRAKDRAANNRVLAAWFSLGGAWEKIPGATMLTVRMNWQTRFEGVDYPDGEIIVNPAAFAETIHSPLQAEELV